MTLRFSIVIPFYNIGENILRCLNSLANQTFRQFEVVLVNDGSEDNSLKIINDFFSKHQDMEKKIITQANAGAGQARNRGMDEAMGEYIVFIDSDDYVDNDFLEKINEKIMGLNADVVFIDIKREDEKGNLIRYERMSNFEELSKERMISWQLTGKLPWGGCRKIIRASIINDNCCRYAPIKVGEESIFSFLALINAERIAFQKTSYYHYVSNSNSLTAHPSPKDSLNVYLYMKTFFDENPRYSHWLSSLNASAVTTLVVCIYELAMSNSFRKTISEAKKYYNLLKKEIKSRVSVDALTKRVWICYPFARLGLLMPLVIIAFLYHKMK